jgi:hypothetical protein
VLSLFVPLSFVPLSLSCYASPPVIIPSSLCRHCCRVMLPLLSSSPPFVVPPCPLAPAFHPASSRSQRWRQVLGWSLWCPPCVVHQSGCRPLAPAFHPVSSRWQRWRWVLGSCCCVACFVPPPDIFNLKDVAKQLVS